MGRRSVQPAEKKARATKAAPSLPAAKKPRAAAPKASDSNITAPAAEQPIVLSAADRENPEKLSGQALKDLAHRRGMAKSILATMPDDKIRMELRYIVNRQYGEDALA